MKIIPFQNFTAFSQEVTLDDTPYKLSFYWNSRDEAWFMTIVDREENELIRGIKLVLNYPLLNNHRNRGLPPGEIIIIDPSDGPETISYDDFTGARGLLMTYLTETEVAAI